jgi:hypothetical protein
MNCQHCGRAIELTHGGVWVDPEATGDDIVWREVCDAHDTFRAEHEPAHGRPNTVGYNDALWGTYYGHAFQGDARAEYDAGHAEGAAVRQRRIAEEDR